MWGRKGNFRWSNGHHPDNPYASMGAVLAAILAAILRNREWRFLSSKDAGHSFVAAFGMKERAAQLRVR